MTTLFPQGTHGASRIGITKDASLDLFVGGGMLGSSAWIGRKQTEQGDNKGLRAARTVFAFPKPKKHCSLSLSIALSPAHCLFCRGAGHAPWHRPSGLRPEAAFRLSQEEEEDECPGKANATNSVASSPAKPRQSTEARGDDAASSAAGLKTTRTRQLKSRPGLSCARRSLRRWALASDAAPSTCAHVMLVSHS